VLERKLEALKLDLKKLNEDIFGNVGKQKKDFLDDIHELDIIAEGRPLIENERSRLERIILLEEVSWR
jgi:hypothetical protein